jgi:hypothetical protein
MSEQIVSLVMRFVASAVLIAFVIFYVKRAGGILEVFRNFIDLVNGAESAWLNAAAALIPYGVSLIPASLTFRHVISELGFDFWTALDAGIVVELFGVVAMQTIIKFWQNNKKYTSEKSENRAPLGLAIFAYAFYLIITLTVNVVLEIVAGTRGFWGILAIGLFSLLGIPSGILIAIRAQHKEIVDSRVKSRTGNAPVISIPQIPSNRTKPASAFRAQMIDMLNQQYSKDGRILELTEITGKLKLDHATAKGFVSTLRTNWMAEKGIQKPPKSGDGLTF